MYVSGVTREGTIHFGRQYPIPTELLLSVLLACRPLTSNPIRPKIFRGSSGLENVLLMLFESHNFGRLIATTCGPDRL